MDTQKEIVILDELDKIKTYSLFECKNKIKSILINYKDGELLWIVQHLFHNLNIKKLLPYHINPVHILITRNINKIIPSSSYAIILMILTLNNNDDTIYQDLTLYLFNTAYELLLYSEY
jgi:hypothetical protein